MPLYRAKTVKKNTFVHLLGYLSEAKDGKKFKFQHFFLKLVIAARSTHDFVIYQVNRNRFK